MSEYNENALYYHEQVVILDTTNAGSSSGGLIVRGGISGKDTYITGHVSVNNVKITPNKNDIIFEQQAILSRTENFTDITDFYFDDSVANSFKATINVTVSGGISKYALWEINGVYKPSGWVITSSFAGDQTGINFKIVNLNGRGQIQYTNLNDVGTTTTIRYRANTTAPPGTTPLGSDSGIINNTSGPYIANRLLYSNSTDTIANTDLVYASNVFTIGGTSRILAQNANSFTNFSNGGAITSMGDASVAKKMIVGEKVGIVTTAPQFHLDVTGDINFTGNFYKNGSLYSGSSIWDTNANSEIFTQQNLGIGTSDPTYKLDVSGGIRVTEAITAGALHVTNEIATNISSGTLNLSTGLSSGSAKITDIANTNSSIGTLNVTALTAGNINFTGTLYENGTPYVNSQWTTGTGGNLSYTNGNVGINTTAPKATLDVSGTINVSTGVTAANLNVSGATVLGAVTTGTVSASTINSSVVAASIITGGSLSLSGDLFVAGSLTAVNITTTNLMDTNITAGVAKITDAGITTATIAALLNTNAVSTNISSATLTLSTGLTSSSAQITNQNSTNISSATLILSTGLTTASLQATNVNATTATVATLIATNQTVTNVSSATLNLSTGLTSASVQATNLNATTGTVATLLTTNAVATNVSAGTLNLSTGLTSNAAQITNQTSTNISSGTLNVSTGLTTASLQASNVNATTVTVGTLLNTNAVSTNVSAGTANLSTGLTAASAQITNENVTTSTIGTARVTTSLLAIGTSNTIGNIFTTGGNVGVGVVNPSLSLEVSGRSVMKNAGTGTSGALYLDDSNKGIEYSGNNGSVNSYFQGSFPSDGIAVFGFSDGALGTKRGGSRTALAWNSIGNVGIGTTAPSNTLDVSGTARITTSVTTGALFTTNITSTNVVATNSSLGTINASGATIGGTVVPSANITYDLGSANLRWKDLYLSGNTIHLGEKQLSLAGDAFTVEKINILSTDETISSTTGAFVVNGGVGISKSLNVNGTVSSSLVSSTNISSTGLTSASAQITNANITTSTIATLRNTNAISTNISSATLNLSTGLTSASAQLTNANVTTATIATLLNTNTISTNISSGTLNLSTGLTSASAQITTSTIGTVRVTNTLDVNGDLSSNNYRLENWSSDALGVNNLGTTTYYKIATLPTTGDTSGSGGVSIRGMIGGWTNSEIGNIDLFFGTRNGQILRGEYYGGTVSTVIGYVDLQVRIESNFTHSVYLKCNSFFKFDIIVAGSGLNVTLLSPTSTGTTSPTGSVQTASLVSSLQMYNIAGNVGIGTNNPGATLDVSGTGRITTSLTTGALYSTNQTSTNIVSTNLSSGTISATTFTGGSLSLSGNLNVAGTLTTVNITSTNLVNTNVSAGIVVASTSLSATGASNTIGSIFTNSGNVGIGTTSPSSRLHIVNNSTGSNNLVLGDSGSTTTLDVFAGRKGASLAFGGWTTLDPNGGTTGSNGVFIYDGLEVSGSITSASLTATNIVATNVSSGTLNITSINQGSSNSYSGSATAGNNVSTPTNVSGLVFTTYAFTAKIVVRINGSNLYEYFNIDGINTNSGWTIFTDSVGDVSGLTFSVTAGGQIQYISTNNAGWTSTNIQYYVVQF